MCCHRSILVHRSYPAYLCDMDGVLHRTGVAIDGAAEFLARLREKKLQFLLLTNEDRYTNATLSTRLQQILGVDDKTAPLPEEIYSSANSVRDFFLRLFRHSFDGSVYVIGEAGLVENVRAAYNKGTKRGKVFTGADAIDADAPSIQYVVIGCVFAVASRFLLSQIERET